jgi:N-acetylglucosamine-6-phosphate deacetylase
MRLRSHRIVCPEVTLDGEVAVEEGQIVSVGRPSGEVPDFDLGDSWLLPGFIDAHVHGGGGAQCNTASPEEIDTVARFHASHGTTGLLATTVAAPPDELCTALDAIARCPSVLGSHLEGPFLNPRQPGAMDPGVFADPDPELLDRLLTAGNGTVRLMTLAPELPGALALVDRLAGAGVVASLGHSDATYAETEAAVRAGARAATHVFNAMRPLHHREPGVLGAVLDLSEVSCELICDGVHLAPAACRLVFSAKGLAGVRLVTDAMEAAGMADGEYRLGDRSVSVSAGRAELAGGGSLAGSTLTMDLAVRNAVEFLGVSVEQAAVMASTNPARLLGVGSKGVIAGGADADLVVLDDGLTVRGTMVGGAWVVEP